MSSIQVLVNVQGLQEEPHHYQITNAALQKLLCEAWLMVDIPHIPPL